MIEILTAAQVDRARRTGALVADILRSLRERSLVGTNLLDLDRWTAEMIREAGAESCYVDYAPSFGRGSLRPLRLHRGQRRRAARSPA